MANTKKKERQLAYLYYVEHGLSGKECARKAGVTQKTVSAWVARYRWKEERNARILSLNQRIEHMREVLGGLAEESVMLTRQLREASKRGDRGAANDLRLALASISDQASKWTKSLDTIQTKERVSLSVYLTVMDELFRAIHARHPDIYHQLIDFQEDLVHRKAAELG